MGNLVLGAALGQAVGEVRLVIVHHVMDIVGRQPFQPTAQARQKLVAVHATSPNIFWTEASNAFQSAICDLSASAPERVSL